MAKTENGKKKGRTRKRPEDPIERELDAIKRLLMLDLVRNRVPIADIALALGVTQSAISETVPVRKLTLSKD